ncbi:hypothetical protein M5689_018744 [Euphorbia peplus]|nr:hypothetical protein M5689_018744 [Euphorbia peplus]
MVYLGKERLLNTSSSKLRPRKYDPYKIMKKLSSNAYHVALPNWLGKLSPSFNVKYLSPFKPDIPLEYPLQKLGYNSLKERENDENINHVHDSNYIRNASKKTEI